MNINNLLITIEIDKMEISYPDSMKKYAGVIKQNIDKCYYSFSYQNKELNQQVKRKFPYFDEPSRQLAHKAAMEYKIQYSIENHLVFNRYWIERDDEGDEYLRVALNVDNVFLIVDKKDLPLIENFDWRIQNNSTYATCYMNDADYQRFHSYLLSIKNAAENDQIQYLFQQMIENIFEEAGAAAAAAGSSRRHYLPFHLLKYGLEHVDFLNKNRLDNRDKNIGLLSKSQHSWKSQVGDAKLRINNSSGKAGVFYGKCGNYDYWEVRGKDYFGNKIYKKFSIQKYGYEGSRYMAINFRDMIIDKSYKPHQLDEIYKKIIHDFDHLEDKFQLQNFEITLVDNHPALQHRENQEIEDDQSVVSKMSKYRLLDEEDEDFIIVES